MNNITNILFIFGISALAGTLVPILVSWLAQPDKIKQVSIILVVLSLIGASAGLAGGMSRTAAVGTIIPAFLGLLGGLSIYLFGIDQSKGLVASFGAASLSLSLIVSYTWAAQFRNLGDDQRDLRSICASAYVNPSLLSNTEAFKLFRERMGRLCDAAMSWNFPDSRA